MMKTARRNLVQIIEYMEKYRMNTMSLTKSLAAVCASTLSAMAFAAGGAAGNYQSNDPNKHFHPQGKPPSEHTLAVIRAARKSMPFDDTRDFDEARKGFIAPLISKVVQADAGHVAWDIERYDFVAADNDWDSIHPSTQGQGALNQITGL